jgi:hypothetical protein
LHLFAVGNARTSNSCLRQGQGEEKAMLRLVRAFVVASIVAVTLAFAPTAGSQGVTQLVISGQTPPGVTTGNLDGFGIWVWCQDPAAGNPYAGECAGSIYFYNLGLVRHVDDEEDTLVLTSTSFSVELVSEDGSVDCTVSGSLPSAKGPSAGNTISVSCSSPDRSGTLSNLVLNVT